MKIKGKDGCVYEFVSHKWLASNVGDGKTSRELNGKSRCPTLDTPTKGTCHKISIGCLLSEECIVAFLIALSSHRVENMQ